MAATGTCLLLIIYSELKVAPRLDACLIFAFEMLCEVSFQIICMNQHNISEHHDYLLAEFIQIDFSGTSVVQSELCL